MRAALVLASLPPAIAGPAAAAQTLGQGEAAGIPWLRLAAALILCAGLAIGWILVLRRRMGAGAPTPAAGWSRLLAELRLREPTAAQPRLTDIETRRVSPQVTVSVFRCDGRDFMVAASLQGQLVLIPLDPETPGTSE